MVGVEHPDFPTRAGEVVAEKMIAAGITATRASVERMVTLIDKDWPNQALHRTAICVWGLPWVSGFHLSSRGGR